MLTLPAIGETVPVYEGRFRMTRDITFGQGGAVRPFLQPDGTLRVEDSIYYQACDDRVCYLPQTVPVHWIFRYAEHDRERSPEPLRRRPRASPPKPPAAP